MGYFSKLLNIFFSSYKDRHIWNICVGKNQYPIQDILNNYNILGQNKSEIQDFLKDYIIYEKTPDMWIYELKQTKKHAYLLILFFNMDKLVKVNYSNIEYKSSNV